MESVRTHINKEMIAYNKILSEAESMLFKDGNLQCVEACLDILRLDFGLPPY